MQPYIFIGLLGIHVVMGALSSWMRENGYHLAGHTRKEKLAVPTVEDCWETCLQEAEFECLSVAYAAVGNQSCRLYDKKALSVYRDWTHSNEFSYYEYCANGIWTWSVYKYTVVVQRNLVELTNVDVQDCLDHCRSLPACGAVDYQPGNRKCHMNSVTGVADAVSVFRGGTATSDAYTRCYEVTYDYLFRRLSPGMDLSNMWFSYGILDINGNTKTEVVEVRYRNLCPLLCLSESRCLAYQVRNATAEGATVCKYILSD